MGVPSIGQLLRAHSHERLSEQPILVDALRISSNLNIPRKTKCNVVYQLLKEQDPDVLDLTVNKALNPDARNAGRSIMTVIMNLMLIAMAGSICAANIYIAISKGQAIQWGEAAIVLCCPILVVLHDRGLLRKENKDILMALLGRSPIPTIGEAIATRYSQPRSGYVEDNHFPAQSQEEVQQTTSNSKYDY